MIKNLAITPPVVGRISIGRVVEKNGKRLPEKDDQFTITTQVQTKEGWMLHPYDEQFRKGASGGKLRSIPVKMLFDDPDLNLRAEYTLFERGTGRPVCMGNGETAKRDTGEGVAQVQCPGPDLCDMGKRGGCKPFGRLSVKMEGQDDIGVFLFRTTGYNSIRSLAARLAYYQAVSGGLLSCMPLELRLRGKSTAMSHRAPVYYVDLEVRQGLALEEAIAEAKDLSQKRKSSGFDQASLDKTAEAGFKSGMLDWEEGGGEVVEEFFPELGAEPNASNNAV